MLCSFLFFKQKKAYEMRISDWSSYVCSSDLGQYVPQASAAHSAPRIVATVKKAKPTAMARYMMSSSTSSDGSLLAIGRRKARMPATIMAPMPKYSIHTIDSSFVPNTNGSEHNTAPSTNSGISLARDVV